MVTSFYKWSLLFCVAICSAFSTVPSGGRHVNAIHPFHVSTTEITHNATDKTLEVSCRIFTDDFEDALKKESGLTTDFSKESLKTRMDEVVKKYLGNHLALRVNGKPAVLSCLGWEIENEAVYVYLQVDGVSSVTQVELVNTLMFNLFDDQINIVHIRVNGNRKSHKLTYPEKDLLVRF